MDSGEADDEEQDGTMYSDQADEDDAEPVDPVLAAASSCVMDSGGYITSDLPPWNTLGRLGRITQWPAANPKNCSMRCYRHTGCNLEKSRAATTYVQLILWLFKGKPSTPGMTAEERRKLRGDHQKAAWEM